MQQPRPYRLPTPAETPGITPRLHRLPDRHRIGRPLPSSQRTRWSGTHADDALRQANQRFGKRYLSMENLAAERGLDFDALPLDQKEELWREAKRLVG